jgi:energy-coupling factor transporter ATP-binding protein EcfA2
MSVFDSTVTWAAQDLPDWQSDAVRRLLTQNALTPADEQELLLMLKAKNGLLKPTETSPRPKPVDPVAIPGTSSTSQEITLHAIKDMTNVNAIRSDSPLTFGPEGLTIIYGDNASGKSGYARVLKKACRARHTVERIHPNVYEKPPDNPASASFVLSIADGQPHEFQWVDETISPDIFANICVFDSKCARIIIDEENELVYLPYGASVFHDLVTLLQKLRESLKAECPHPNHPETDDIPPTTEAGKFIAGLSPNTTIEALQAATKWSSQDEKELHDLTQDIAKATAEDPTQHALRVRNLKARISELRAAVQKIEAVLSPEVAEILEKQIYAVNTAQHAFTLACQQSPSPREEPLPGVGNDEWKLLYQAAQQYSIEVAYKDKDFPYTGDDSLCVLCMQPLSQDAKDRFYRFKSFMEEATKKLLDAAEAELMTTYRQLADLNFEIMDTHKDALDEIATRKTPCASSIKAYIEKALVAKMTMESAVQSLTVTPHPPMPPSPAIAVKEIEDAMEQEATKLDKAADPTRLASLQYRKAELEAQKKLVAKKKVILQYLADLKRVALYDLCLQETETASITRKGREIVSSALTEPFQKLLNKELGDMGSTLRLALEPRGVTGETIHKLTLANCQLPPHAKVTDILSEGEQRIVSIASFLAELKVCAHNNPVVFDDPVSSLDHDWREKLAERLASEAASRQLIVFTHDIVFTIAAMDAAEVARVPLTIRCILRRGKVPGTVEEALPWKAANVRQSIDTLKKTVAQLRNIRQSQTTEQYSEAARSLYSKMRATWEKAIEQVVFCSTVLRYRTHIPVNRTIMKVTVFDLNDCRTLLAAYKNCCDITDAHDNIGPRSAHIPSLDEIATDITTLAEWVANISNKQEAIM